MAERIIERTIVTRMKLVIIIMRYGASDMNDMMTKIQTVVDISFGFTAEPSILILGITMEGVGAAWTLTGAVTRSPKTKAAKTASIGILAGSAASLLTCPAPSCLSSSAC